MLYYNCVGPSVWYLICVGSSCWCYCTKDHTHHFINKHWDVLAGSGTAGPLPCIFTDFINSEQPEGSDVSARTSKHQAGSVLAGLWSRTVHLRVEPLNFCSPPDVNNSFLIGNTNGKTAEGWEYWPNIIFASFIQKLLIKMACGLSHICWYFGADAEVRGQCPSWRMCGSGQTGVLLYCCCLFMDCTVILP